MRKPVLVIITSFKFGQYDYERFEVDKYVLLTNIEILDISWFIDSALNQGTVNKEYNGNDLTKIRTIYELRRKLSKYKRESKKRKIVFLSLVNPFSIKTILYYILLKLYGFEYIDYRTSGCPSIIERNKIINRVVKYRTQPRFLLTSLVGVISSLLFRILRLYPRFRLVAGQKEYQKSTDQLRGRKTTILRGSANDYVMYINQLPREKGKKLDEGSTGVLLDGAAPLFGSDSIALRKKEPFTAKKWYSSMVRFLDNLENMTGATIKVAGHPKSNHPKNPPYLGFRDVIYGDTINLISQADFVITRNSGSIAWGILFNKPVILVYNDQLLADDKFMRSINNLSWLVGAKPINIDNLRNQPIIMEDIKANKLLYKKYINDYLTSRNDSKSNAEVILEEVFNIRAGQQ